MRRDLLAVVGYITLVLIGAAFVSSQETPATAPTKPVLSPTLRLTAAKNAFIRHSGGSDIPYNVISAGIEGWGRLTLVEDPAKADLILEVSSPSDGSGVSVSSTTLPSSRVAGRTEQGTTTTRDLSNAPVKLVVIDAKSKTALWSATEQPKFGLKQKARQDNLVEAAQRLVTKLRERIEPEATR